MKAANLASIVDESLFIDDFGGYSWSELLAYFQGRTHVNYFPLSKGAPKHVTNADYILANEFDFNNEKCVLGESFDWRINPSKDIEWLILLHKFYYLKDLAGAYDYTQDERYAQKWVSLIDSWISQVPDGFIDSQVTGRRLQQWLLSYQTFVVRSNTPALTPAFFGRFMSSIHSQTHYLCNHLTPEGNHRTLELYAIFLVAVTFPELQSSHWFLAFSKQKLLENMRQDLLPDGVHRELSTDYHHTVLKNYLRFRGLAVLNNIALPSACDALIKQAIEFSYYVHKPDGVIPAINDGDCNSYLPMLKKAHTYYPDPHLQYVISQGEDGAPPAQRSRGFADSGYYVLRSDWTVKPYSDALYLFFDCAPLGFGSHGHYDALNIEMAAYGHPLIVDPGRFTYNEDSDDGINWRHKFKGTAAHNTVVVDGLDQMPYRSGRPVDPEPEVRLKHFVSTAGFDFLHGQVISQQYPVVHERMIYFALPEYWIVADQLKAESIHRYDLYFHLASRAQGHTSLASNDVCHIVRSPNLLIAQPKDSATDVAVEQGYVSPEYGIKHKAPIIRFSKQQAGTTAFHTVIYPYRDDEPALQVTEIPVYQNRQLCGSAEASALQINLAVNENTYVDYFFSNPGATKAEYSFADVHCICRMLFIRRNSSGKIVTLQAEDTSFIALNGNNFLNLTADSITLSYANQYLSLTTSRRTLMTELDKIEGFHFEGNDNVAKWWLEILDGHK
jgi:Heparinase II/III N-terminus/Heparinase II/III-like protein